jgi:RNA polymerase sigma-70 factor (ECF subfamily)
MATESYDDDAATDDALVRRWLAGDERAATAIVGRHADALARFAAGAGEREGLDELVQDTFVRAFGSLETFRGDSSLRTWLFTIERRLMLDRRRAARRERAHVVVGEPEGVVGHDALDSLVATETEARVRGALERLSPMQRDVFTLRVGEGRSYREIAEVLGSTEGAARVHYHNAMRQIKELIDD